MTLIYIIGTLLLFLVVILNLNNLLFNQSTSSLNYYEALQARNIGNSMIAMLTSRISDSSNYRQTTVQTQNLFSGQAQYYVRDTIVSPDSLIKISVTASYMGQTNNMISILPRSISVLPPAFAYVLFSGGNMSISGNTQVSANSGNANVQTNSSFSINGNSTHIGGFVGYGTSISGKTQNIVPFSNPGNLSAYSQTAPVTIPTFNPDNYKSIATQVYTGDFSVPSTYNLGTLTNPAIVYVGGNLTMSSCTVSGNIIFLVKGTITMSGGCTFVNTSTTNSNFAYYAVGDITASGGSKMYGQMLSLGNISITGGSSLAGTAAAAGTFTISGGNDIYVPASTALTNTIWNNSQSLGRPLVAKYYYE